MPSMSAITATTGLVHGAGAFPKRWTGVASECGRMQRFSSSNSSGIILGQRLRGLQHFGFSLQSSSRPLPFGSSAAPTDSLSPPSSMATAAAAAEAATSSTEDDLLALAVAASSSSSTTNSSECCHYYSPLVKMCGITSPEDASLAAQAGACYVGMIMWPHSKRSVKSLTVAAEICSAAREFGAEPVGVFVSESAGEIERACDAVGLSFCQLHGDGARASALELSRSMNIIYVMQADAQGRLQTTISPEQGNVVDWVLVDGMEGGSGLPFAWNDFKVPPLLRDKGWLLAGGLSPDNVSNAISAMRPNAVDVSSGIAGSDGIQKDPKRISAFMRAVNNSSDFVQRPLL